MAAPSPGNCLLLDYWSILLNLVLISAYLGRWIDTLQGEELSKAAHWTARLKGDTRMDPALQTGSEQIPAHGCMSPPCLLPRAPALDCQPQTVGTACPTEGGHSQPGLGLQRDPPCPPTQHECEAPRFVSQLPFTPFGHMLVPPGRPSCPGEDLPLCPQG